MESQNPLENPVLPSFSRSDAYIFYYIPGRDNDHDDDVDPAYDPTLLEGREDDEDEAKALLLELQAAVEGDRLHV